MFIPDRSIFQLTLDALPDGVLLTDRDQARQAGRP